MKKTKKKNTEKTQSAAGFKDHKPTIETIINTAALALTAWGTNAILQHDYYGFLVILFGMGLEFFKYWGRSKSLW